MKNTIKIFTVFALLSVVFASCKEDKPEVTNPEGGFAGTYAIHINVDSIYTQGNWLSEELYKSFGMKYGPYDGELVITSTGDNTYSVVCNVVYANGAGGDTFYRTTGTVDENGYLVLEDDVISRDYGGSVLDFKHTYGKIKPGNPLKFWAKEFYLMGVDGDFGYAFNNTATKK